MVNYSLDHQIDKKTTYDSVNRKATNQLVKHPMKDTALAFKKFEKLLQV